MTTRLKEALFSRRPYFGPAMRALQGVPIRHAYMRAVVELFAKESHTGPFKMLEVGAWAGGSAITWAKAIQEYIGDGQVVCVDAWQPYFDASIDHDLVYMQMNESAENGSIYGLFLHNIRTSGVADLILPIIGNSRDVLPTLEKGGFSIVFLDGSHRFADVKDDIRLSLDILKEGGILCGDDLELQLSEVGVAEAAEDVASNRDYIQSKLRGVSYHPGVTCAVAEAFGEVSAWEGFWAMRKTATGWIKVDLSSCSIIIPEHIDTAEPFSTEHSDEVAAAAAMAQIAKRIASLDASEYDQNVPQLLGSYAGFNIVKHGGYYYNVRQSLGPIDFLLSYSELTKRYAKADFFRCTDIHAMLYGIALENLVSDMEKLSSIVIDYLLRQEQAMSAAAEQQAIKEQLLYLQQQAGAGNKRTDETDRLLGELLERFNAFQTTFSSERQIARQEIDTVRQEAAAMHERAMAMVDALEAQLTRLAEDSIFERQANKHEVDTVCQEAAAAHQCAMMLQAQLMLCQSEIGKQQQLIVDLQENWAIRIARGIKRVLRGDK